ncbi:MAG: bifunctional metallophosphatase/5'-nucleotidase [Clostridia bacterium]|nr:bifunctional metallophosphatase/5'-nucleotidase [Clostridia bacterium]
MKQKKKGLLRRIGCVLVVLALLATGWAFAEGAQAPQLKKDLVVLFTSDVHCGVDRGFGYVGLKAIRNQLEREGCHVLLVDNGDAMQGGPLGLLTQGEAMIELMNRMGYDIAIPGNHDFDYGMERFLSLTEAADFPFICCNFNREGQLVFPPYIMKEFDGVKLAFVGVTTPQTLYTSTPRYFQDENGNFIYGFMQGNDGADLYEAVQRAADDARSEGADYVILLGHLGHDAVAIPYTYADVLGHTTGIDAMLDGHSHDTSKVVMKNRDGREIIRQASGTQLEGIGWLRISAADGSLDTGLYTWSDPVPAPKLLGIENEMSAVVDEAQNALGEWLNTKVGVSTAEQTIYDPTAMDEYGRPLLIVRVSETNLGDLVTDAFRAQSGTDVAIDCAGSIRTNLPKGDITLSNLLSIYPFGNHVSMRQITGQQLLDALEWGVKDVPGGFGGFLQVSGLSYEFNPNIKSSCQMDENNMFAGVTGEYRVKNVTVGGEPLDLERTYKVAAMDYLLLNHGNGFTMFDGGKILWQSEDLDYLVVARYIRDGLNGVVGEAYENPYGQGRIVAVEESVE